MDGGALLKSGQSAICNLLPTRFLESIGNEYNDKANKHYKYIVNINTRNISIYK
jgi:hypothetical protein